MKALQILSKNSPSSNSKTIYCSLNESVTSVKCKLSSVINVDARLLELFETIYSLSALRNNEYIPRNISSLYYLQIDVDTEDIILKVRRNYCGFPRYIQVNKNEKIKDIRKYFNETSEKYYVFDKDGILQNNDYSWDENGVSNQSKIIMWKGNNFMINLKIRDPLGLAGSAYNDELRPPIPCLVSDTVLQLKEKVSHALNTCQQLPLALFTDNAYLVNEKQLFYYPLQDNDVVYYVNLIKRPSISRGVSIKRGRHAKLYQGRMGDPLLENKKIALLQYKVSDLLEQKVLKYELVTRLTLSAAFSEAEAIRSRFVKLYSIHEDSGKLFIATEWLPEGSLKQLVETAPQSLSMREVLHYGKEIAEGLRFMHERVIIHRNIRCASVLLGQPEYSNAGDCLFSVKLSNFHLSKKLVGYSTEEWPNGVPGSRITDSERWMAPEILAGRTYALKADIWSLGATFVEMLTRNRPYPELGPEQASLKIITDQKIEFDIRLADSRVIDIIDQCLHSSQVERYSADQVIAAISQIESDGDYLHAVEETQYRMGGL